MAPRPAPTGTPYEGQAWVWAVDEKHLPNYLLPRDCPRVCWSTTDVQDPLLLSAAPRVIAIEDAWVSHVRCTAVLVHVLEPQDFVLLDANAGYWVSEKVVHVQQVQRVASCWTALEEAGVDIRPVPSLWPYVDAVVAGCAEFSCIRLRHAQPRSESAL
jgi:hypothetical protein